MIPEKIHVEIVTPERRVLARDVDEVILPGAEGLFGVRPGHAPFLVALGPGVGTVREGGRAETVAIGGGFAEVLPDRVIVLAETCEKADEIDPARAEEKARELAEELRRPAPPEDLEVIRLRMLKHLARVRAAHRG